MRKSPTPLLSSPRTANTTSKTLGGYLPRDLSTNPTSPSPMSTFTKPFAETAGREGSTTMALLRVLQTILRNKDIGKKIVPIIPDEARTFGFESLFSTCGRLRPRRPALRADRQRRRHLMYYKESKDGQVLEEGINEAGSMGSFIAPEPPTLTSAFP